MESQQKSAPQESTVPAAGAPAASLSYNSQPGQNTTSGSSTMSQQNVGQYDVAALTQSPQGGRLTLSTAGPSTPHTQISGSTRAVTSTSHYQGPTAVTESRTTNYTTQVGAPQYSTKETYNAYGASSTTIQQSGGAATRSYPLTSSYRGTGATSVMQEVGSATYSTGPITTSTSFQQSPVTTATYQTSPTVYQSGGVTTYQARAGEAVQQSVVGSTTTTGATYYGPSRIVTGEERVVGYNTIVQEDRIISERIVEHEIKVPKKVVREEVIEKVYVVPETIIREEIVEEIQKIQETIVEVAKPVIQEKIVEVPEIEYREKIIEKVEKIVQEKVREIPKIEYQERAVEVPKIIVQEKVVEVPEIEYREILIEKVVEVPEIRDQVIVKEIPVPQYVDRQVPEYVNVEVPVDLERTLPVPVEAITTFEYQLAQFRPRVNKVQYPLYVPRFVEVPVSAELFDPSAAAQLQAQAARLQVLSSPQAMGLCDIENLATDLRRTDAGVLVQTSNIDLKSALTSAWNTGRLTARGVEGIPHASATLVATN